MKNRIKEAMQPLMPEFPVNIAGQKLTLRFDVNINKTKKGVKLQFILPQIPEDPRKLQDIANKIGSELQEKFGQHNLQIIYDLENPYRNVIGFLIPLPSLADFIINKVLKGSSDGEEIDQEEEEVVEPEEELPPTEQEPQEEPVREILMRRAGLK